jgi:hypothetical protein
MLFVLLSSALSLFLLLSHAFLFPLCTDSLIPHSFNRDVPGPSFSLAVLKLVLLKILWLRTWFTKEVALSTRYPNANLN